MAKYVKEDLIKGIVRGVDDLGRIVVPKELRLMLDIDCGKEVEMKLIGDQVIISKYIPKEFCVFCGAQTNDTFKDKPLCIECVSEIHV